MRSCTSVYLSERARVEWKSPDADCPAMAWIESDDVTIFMSDNLRTFRRMYRDLGKALQAAEQKAGKA